MERSDYKDERGEKECRMKRGTSTHRKVEGTCM